MTEGKCDIKIKMFASRKEVINNLNKTLSRKHYSTHTITTSGHQILSSKATQAAQNHVAWHHLKHSEQAGSPLAHIASRYLGYPVALRRLLLELHTCYRLLSCTSKTAPYKCYHCRTLLYKHRRLQPGLGYLGLLKMRRPLGSGCCIASHRNCMLGLGSSLE